MLSVFVLEGVTEKLLTEVATVTLQVAVRPFTVLAVIVAVPFAMPFTEPLALLSQHSCLNCSSLSWQKRRLKV